MWLYLYYIGFLYHFAPRIPHNYDLAGTIGIWALNFIVGGIIGGFILIWRIAVAIYYIPLTIVRLANIGNV